MCFPPRWERSMQGEHLLGSHRCQNEYLGLGSITSLVSSSGFIFFFPNGARGRRQKRERKYTQAPGILRALAITAHCRHPPKEDSK